MKTPFVLVLMTVVFFTNASIASENADGLLTNHVHLVQVDNSSAESAGALVKESSGAVFPKSIDAWRQLFVGRWNLESRCIEEPDLSAGPNVVRPDGSYYFRRDRNKRAIHFVTLKNENIEMEGFFLIEDISDKEGSNPILQIEGLIQSIKGKRGNLLFQETLEFLSEDSYLMLSQTLKSTDGERQTVKDGIHLGTNTKWIVSKCDSPRVVAEREKYREERRLAKEQELIERRRTEEAKRLQELEEGKNLYCSIQERYWSTFSTKVSDLRSGKRKPSNCYEYAVKQKLRYTTDGFAVKIEPDRKVRVVEGKLVTYRGTTGTIQGLERAGFLGLGSENVGAAFVTDKKTHWINKDSIQVGRSDVSVMGQYVGNSDFTWQDGRVTNGIVLKAQCIESRRLNQRGYDEIRSIFGDLIEKDRANIAPTSSEMLSLLTAEEGTFYQTDLYKKTRWKDLVGQNFEGCVNGEQIRQHMLESTN